jgi:tetratricopeptide (TPR) repeat protein
VGKSLVPCVLLLALAASTLAGQNPSTNPPQQATSAGRVIPQQACIAKPDQSYALYLPSHYIPDKRWPIVYAFDPDGRGSVPVELMKDAAERYGYIVVGSNNSKNGSWRLEAGSAQTMWNDTHARFAIDDRRLYFAGFSGGARVAAALAQQCECAAGVLLSGAGFAGVPPSRDNSFAVFAAAGTFDFNYPELADLDEKLEQAGFPHVLRHFDGPHQWPPVDVIDEAFAWFQLMAMNRNREARDDSFISLQKTQMIARAQALEKSGDVYEAWGEYQQAIVTFDGLSDTTSLQQAAASLTQQKAVRDGAKRERQEFQEQQQLTNEIFAGLAALRSGKVQGGSGMPNLPAPQVSAPQQHSGLGSSQSDVPLSRSDIFYQTEQQIIGLRQRTDSEKHPEKLRVDRRALAGVFINAAEAGDESLTAENYALAKDYFQLASDAYPDSVGALKELAKARALDNDRKGTFEALRHAKEKSKDSIASFTAWLNEEPAFAKLREDPQFRALLANP